MSYSNKLCNINYIRVCIDIFDYPKHYKRGCWNWTTAPCDLYKALPRNQFQITDNKTKTENGNNKNMNNKTAVINNWASGLSRQKFAIILHPAFRGLTADGLINFQAVFMFLSFYSARICRVTTPLGNFIFSLNRASFDLIYS